MKIHILLDNDSELIAYETMSLAFVLASFDNEVQLEFGNATQALLQTPNARLIGMIKSLPLYDLPPAWANFDLIEFSQNSTGAFDDELTANLMPTPTDKPNFDSYLTF